MGEGAGEKESVSGWKRKRGRVCGSGSEIECVEVETEVRASACE